MTDVTIVAYGGMLRVALGAADALAEEGVSAEVVDLRSLRPLDTATIVSSVVHTHRAVVVDEGWRTGSLSAEVSARIVEEAFYDLDAPVGRVCTAEVPMPYAKHLEDEATPQVARRRRRRPRPGGMRWANSRCRRSVPTWTPAGWPGGW